MRKLVYTLADGTVVATQAEAKASGQKYKETVKVVEKTYDESRLTEGQKILRRRLV